jgi:hypothetical protein
MRKQSLITSMLLLKTLLEGKRLKTDWLLPYSLTLRKCQVILIYWVLLCNVEEQLIL